MSEIFSAVDLTEREKYTLRRKFDMKVFQYPNDMCHLWAGSRSRDGYGYLQIVLRGKRQKLAAHRLSYFVAHGFHRLDPRMHVSNLCHNKLCVNADHLSLEPAAINASRSRCVGRNACLGHEGYWNCRF